MDLKSQPGLQLTPSQQVNQAVQKLTTRIDQLEKEINMTVTDCRKEVQEMAVAMEAKLRQHDDRPGWKEEPFEYLYQRLEEEADELYQASKSNKPLNIAEEAVDVANFAMMIWDNFKEDTSSLKEAANPLVKWLNEKGHPHMKAIVTPTDVEIVEGFKAEEITEWVND